VKLPPQQHSAPVPPAAGLQALGYRTSGLPAAPAPAPLEPSIQYGGLFRLPRHSRMASAHRLGVGGTPPRRQRGARSASQGRAGDQDELDDGVEDEASRRARMAAQMQAQTSFGGEGGQGSSGDGREQERRFAVIARARLVPSITGNDDSATERLLQSARTARTLHEVAPALRAAVTHGSTSLSALFVRVAHAWQASRDGGELREAATLTGVKAALLSAAAGIQPSEHTGLGERSAAAALWLPVYLLNLSRPRWPAQSQLAAARLALIERGLARQAARKA
jgi:hypothetical protein